MSQFELTPRTLRLGALVLGALVVSFLIAKVVITMSQKETVTPHHDAASAAGTVEILTPTGSRSTVIQTAPARPTAPPIAASEPSDDANSTAASESDTADNSDAPPAPARRHPRPQAHHDDNTAAAPKPRDDQGAVPVEPIRSTAPRNEPAPDTPKPPPAKKKDGLDNLF